MVMKRIAGMALAAVLLCGCLPPPIAAGAAEMSVGGAAQISQETSPEPDSYAAYQAEYAALPIGTETVDAVLLGEAQALEGKQAVRLDAGEAVRFTLTVPTDGLYCMALSYLPLPEKGKALSLALSINGSVPFEQAAYLSPELRWVDETDEFDQDASGNDIMPEQIEMSQWMTCLLRDPDGYEPDALLFALKAGENTLTLVSSGDPLAVAALQIRPPEAVPNYAEYIKEKAALADNVTQEDSRTIQAEHPSAKSDPMLYAMYDKTSPLTQPSDPFKLKRNIIGGSNWKDPGQYVEWEIEVPADGYYTLGIKFRQNENRGLYSRRRLLIDGTVPFAEVEEIQFDYDSDFQYLVPGDETGDYRFYLTAGTHTLRLEATLGSMAEAVQILEENQKQLSTLRRRILMVTSVSPDLYRDYDLPNEIPGLLPSFRAIADSLNAQLAILEGSGSVSGGDARIIKDVAEQLEDFIARPYTIAERLSKFSDNLSALATYVLSCKEQPLELDYLVLARPGTPQPKVKAGFFEKVAYEATLFVGSFLLDYNQSVSSKTDGEPVEVWMNSGREQIYILRELAEQSELPFPVEFKLVRSSLVQAVMAGIGPDAALSVTRADPVNLGLRGALEPLQAYPGFDDAAAEFSADAFIPYTLEGDVYAMPETQLFNMMFVRTDIFEELGLTVPATWDEFLTVSSILQRNNMEAGLPNADDGTSLFPTLLYQRGSTYYNADKTATNFGTETAHAAFDQWVTYYTDYSFPLFKDDYNRFRSGEMPLAVMNYSLYNQLAMAAPEIRGDWEMLPIPGTVGEDGELNRTETATGTAAVMIAGADNKENTWQFLKWWVSAGTQAAYGRRLEYVLGPAGRYATANRVAFQSLPWSAEEAAVIEQQWDSVTEIPEVPGGYYVTRNLSNAFRAAAIRGENKRQSLNYWSSETDKEIARKRREYHLD